MTEITIEELARQVGMTPRNVRAHQTRGLLPAPRLRGRVAYYGPQHVERLNTITELQSAGLTLEQITDLLDRMPTATPGELLALARTTAAPFSPEPPVIVTAAALRDYWGEQATPELLDRIDTLGHVRRLPNGDYEVRSTRLVRGATELSRLGVPLDAAVDLIEAIWTHQTAAADDIAAFFTRYVATNNATPTDPHELDATLQRLRRLAGESVLAVFGMALEQSLQTALENQTGNSR